MFEKIEFAPGEIVYDDLNVNILKPLLEQLDNLKEDLFQVSYNRDKYIIDLGWYPSFSEKGFFRIMVIKEYEWDEPMFTEKYYNLSELNLGMQKCVNYVRAQLREMA